MRPSLHNLHIAQLYTRIWALGRNEAAERNHDCDCESNSGEEAEDILDPYKGGVHRALGNAAAKLPPLKDVKKKR